MINKFFYILLFIGTTFVYSQENINISGQLVDSETKETIPFVNVSVHNFDDNKLITGTITDMDGRFVIQGLMVGKYELYFSYIGYSGAQQTLVAGGLNSVFYLGKIELAPSAEILEEVQVIGREATTNSDLNKKSFNLENNIAQSGGSVLDAMKTMPGVVFDQEGKVVLRGSDKVVVLIDGKQSSLTGFGNQKGLGSIPASNIEKIEIINNLPQNMMPTVLQVL